MHIPINIMCKSMKATSPKRNSQKNAKHAVPPKGTELTLNTLSDLFKKKCFSMGLDRVQYNHTSKDWAFRN